MKKLMLAAVAASLLATPALAAPPQQWDRHDNGRHNGWQQRDHRAQGNYRNWRRGDRFDHRYARNYREIDYRSYHGLRRPPRGYHWVRSGNDALLVGITTGVIASIIAGAAR